MPQEPCQVTVTMKRGRYIVADPAHSNVIVVGRHWPNVCARVEECLGILLPAVDPVAA